MKKLPLKNKYFLLLALFLLTVAISVPAGFTIAKFTKTVDVGTIRLDFTKEKSPEQQSESFDGSYTVQSGDTLSGIARKYNADVNKLAVYNNITDPSNITVGQVLKIPPLDYAVPKTEEADTTTPNKTAPTTDPEMDTSAVIEPTDLSSNAVDSSANSQSSNEEEK